MHGEGHDGIFVLVELEVGVWNQLQADGVDIVEHLYTVQGTHTGTAAGTTAFLTPALVAPPCATTILMRSLAT
jgi:hypothetical protein